MTDNAASYSYPRTSIAGDRATDSGSGESNGTFPPAAEFAGHRVLTDAQIDALAGEIIREIQKRGPFLSLAEFVNRRLTTDKNLAIAGTIQKALDNLAEIGHLARKTPSSTCRRIRSASPPRRPAPPTTNSLKPPSGGPPSACPAGSARRTSSAAGSDHFRP